MIFSLYAHSLQNAHRAGIILCEPDEYGKPEWMGTQEQLNIFTVLESDYTLL